MSQILVRNDTRNDTTRPCAFCGEHFVVSGRRRYHSDACRAAAHRARHVLVQAPQRVSALATVYECPECQVHLLGEQRCPDCNRFCRSLGPGGECPCCGDPVSVAELLASTATSPTITTNRNVVGLKTGPETL